jgi:hypothetical protein
MHMIRSKHYKFKRLDTILTSQQLSPKRNHFVPLMKQTYETLQEEWRWGIDHLGVVMHVYILNLEKMSDVITSLKQMKTIFHGNREVPNALYNIVIQLQRGELHPINERHPLYLPLHYVLIFSYGELRWHPNISHVIIHAHQTEVTQIQFFSYLCIPKIMNIPQYFLLESYCMNSLLMFG